MSRKLSIIFSLFTIFECRHFAVCPGDQFQCADQSCIDQSWVCDGVTDCPGETHPGSDEQNCGKWLLEVIVNKNAKPWRTCLQNFLWKTFVKSTLLQMLVATILLKYRSFWHPSGLFSVSLDGKCCFPKVRICYMLCNLKTYISLLLFLFPDRFSILCFYCQVSGKVVQLVEYAPSNLIGFVRFPTGSYRRHEKRLLRLVQSCAGN